MGKTIQFIQQPIDVGDEDMPGQIAGLYPKTSKIADAAVQFIDSTDKFLHDDKTIVTMQVATALVDAMGIAQEIIRQSTAMSRLIRQSAAMSRLIRNPYQAFKTLNVTEADTKDETGEETGEDTGDEVTEKAVA